MTSKLPSNFIQAVATSVFILVWTNIKLEENDVHDGTMGKYV